jgi:hypothetical protein
VQNTKEDKENKANEYLSQLQNSRECNNGEINSQSLCDDQKDDRVVQNNFEHYQILASYQNCEHLQKRHHLLC